MAHSCAPRTMRKKPSSPQSRPQLLATVQNLVLWPCTTGVVRAQRKKAGWRAVGRDGKPVLDAPADDLDGVGAGDAALDVLVDAAAVRVEVLEDEHHALDGAVPQDLGLHRLLADKRLGRRAVQPVAQPAAPRPARTLAHTRRRLAPLLHAHTQTSQRARVVRDAFQVKTTAQGEEGQTETL